MADVQLPGLGKVNKKWVLGVGGISAVILGYAYYKHRNAAGPITATPNTGDGTAVDPSIDPTTGLPYTDGYTDPSYYEAGGGYSAAGYYDPATGTTVTTGSGQVTTIAATNASWAQQAENYLIGLQYDSQTSAAAIGKVFTGQSITQAQADIWAAATAFEGEPPQGHPPLNIHPDGSGTTTPYPGKNLPAPTGLKATTIGKTTASFSWSAVPHATSYRLYDNHSSTNVGSSQSTKITVGDLDHNSAYKFHVRAIGSDGNYGPPSASVAVHTKK